MSTNRTTHFAHLLFLLISTPLFANQNWSDDIQYFRETVFEADLSFSDTERANAKMLLDRLENSYQEMSEASVELALAEIMAVSNNGHSFLMTGGWTHRYPRIPVQFRVFADGIFIISANEEFESLVGRKLLGIEGNSVEKLQETWSKYQGGLSGWRNLYLPYFLETPAILHAAGIAAEPSSLVLELATNHDEPEQLEILATDDLPPLEGMDQYIAPSQLLVVSSQKPNSELPLYLQSPGQAFRFEMLENPKTAYIQFKANVDFTGNQDIDAFLDSVFGALRNSRPQYVILDQRFNFGGDLNITRELMQKIPEFLGVDGKIYIVTSGRTFSAGISSAGYIKQSAGAQAVIVGEPIGDELEFWAEGELEVLPDSGVTFLIGTERHNYLTGCPEDDCHGSIQRHPIRVDSLQPDLPAPLTYADWENGTDPALEAIETEIKSL
ncbi:MAG TPA: hypothetical protein VJ984_03115 [Xanthomonadales bacterium]|nr:hypothetical protein [Xanthomonadales bacterium]